MKIEGTDIEKKIIPLYLEGKTIPEIAKEFCIKDCAKLRNSINEYLEQNNLKRKIRMKRIASISEEDIYKLRNSGKTYYEIGLLYNISEISVKKLESIYCSKHNIVMNRIERKETKLVLDSDLVRDFDNGMSIKSIAKKYEIGSSTVYTRIYELLPLERIKLIQRRNRTKKYFTIERANTIKELYEQGKSMTAISKQMKIGKEFVNRILEGEYKKQGLEEIPRIVSKENLKRLITKDKLNKEQVLEEAKKSNLIIPEEYLKEFFGDEIIDINKIRKFVISEFADKIITDDEKKLMFKNFNIAKILKENEFDIKHQALALVYSLPKITKTRNEDIYKVLNNDDELIQAFNILNSDELNQELYLENLKQCEIAKNVKLAIKLEEIREHNLKLQGIDKNQYEVYKKMSEDTKLKKEYNLAIRENDNIRNDISR